MNYVDISSARAKFILAPEEVGTKEFLSRRGTVESRLSAATNKTIFPSGRTENLFDLEWIFSVSNFKSKNTQTAGKSRYYNLLKFSSSF